MFPEDTLEIFIHVIKSWQVIVVSVILVFYVFLINFTARTYHRPRFVSNSKPKKPKREATVKVKPKEKSVPDNSDEALGLE